MPVTSTTLSGVPVYQLSGVVTDAQLGTALAGTISNGVYVTNRALFVDQTADLTSCTGGFLIDFGTQVLPAIILDTRRDRTKSVFRNFTFLQRTGLSVPQRVGFVQTWNGTSLANAGAGLSIDGLAQSGGGFIYGVPGVNPAGGDNRWLNEMAFAGPMADNTISSQQFTLEELQVCMGASTTIKGMTFEKAYGFPQLSPASANANVTVYRSNQNTESLANGGLIPIRLFPNLNRWASVCYVDSYVTRQGADITTRLINGFGSTSTSRAHFTVLNNYTRESWFGAAKTVMAITSWGASNTIHGGVLKKLRFVDGAGGVVKAYDSRSTIASQRCKFAETGFFDFLEDSLAPEVDSEGRIQVVHIGAIATGLTAAITRYTAQKLTFQKFGKRVIVGDADMTSGDNDLSAFTPVILTEQAGIVRTQSAINSSTEITSFQDLLEELHVLAVGLTGAASYNGYADGNLFTYEGGVLRTNFASVVVDATAAQKISYDSATNSLTIKSSILTDTVDVTRWNNPSGTITLANGAVIQGLYTSSAGNSSIIELNASAGSSVYFGNNATGVTTMFNADVLEGAQRVYFAPGIVTPQLVARELYGFQRFAEVVTPNGTLISLSPVDIPDVGITEETLATVQAYTAINTPSKFYDRTAAFRLTEQGIKLGQMVTRAGTALEIGTLSHLINKDAAQVYSVTGTTITTKSVSYEQDSRYQTEIATPPATIEANTDEVITINIEDANGDSSVSINGGDGTFELWKVTSSTATNDYETGTLLDTVSNGIYRFLSQAGFDIVGVDINSNIRRRSSMSKGIYTQAFYVGDQIQLAQAPQVVENGVKLDILQVEINSIKDKTSNLTFTQTGAVDANIQYVNDIEVKGVGTEANPWNPV